MYNPNSHTSSRDTQEIMKIYREELGIRGRFSFLITGFIGFLFPGVAMYYIVKGAAKTFGGKFHKEN
jgi:hypothetical protein